MSHRTDLTAIDAVHLRVHGSRIVDTYVHAVRFRVDDDEKIHHAIDSDAAEELLFSLVRWHTFRKLAASYQWHEPIDAFVSTLQRPLDPELGVDFDMWQPDTDLAAVEVSGGPAPEFWLEDMPTSASFTVVPAAEYDAAVRPDSVA